ncbi:MAG: type II toxin-antitoxin system YafQ family toxin [Psychrosphaera sp.]|nr:type II toxin-antitoxin system YafQ family toxin [Psychrosphaera sp.]
MLQIITTTKFGKDSKRMHKRGADISILKGVLVTLASQQKLPTQYRDHALTGNYKDCRECHLSPDWLLIYKIFENSLILERTGSHSDLFK